MIKKEKEIYILKETNPNEKRVILLPEEVKTLIKNNFITYVGTGAGKYLGIKDSDYESVGAKIITNKEIWDNGNYIVKYKAPNKEEYNYFKENIILCAFFHAEGNLELTKKIYDSKMTAYSYELFETHDGIFPLNMASSEIAGKMAIIQAAYHLQTHQGGSGILLADVISVNKPKVVVIGYGNAGSAAINTAIALGCHVVVFGSNKERLRKFSTSLPSTVKTHILTKELLKEEVSNADVVIGALRISTFDTEEIMTEEIVRTMKKGSIIVDLTCGYGKGYMPTFDKQTDFKNTSYTKYGVLHIKNPMLPSSVPITTNTAVSRLIVPYLITLGEFIFNKISDDISERGKIIAKGKIIHNEVKRHMRDLLDDHN